MMVFQCRFMLVNITIACLEYLELLLPLMLSLRFSNSSYLYPMGIKLLRLWNVKSYITSRIRMEEYKICI